MAPGHAPEGRGKIKCSTFPSLIVFFEDLLEIDGFGFLIAASTKAKKTFGLSDSFLMESGFFGLKRSPWT